LPFLAVHRLRKRFGQLLRAGVAETVAAPAEVDAESRHVADSRQPRPIRGNEPELPWLQSALPRRRQIATLRLVRLRLENLPASLASQRDTIARCLEAMDQVMPLRTVYLFGSHARGDARPDSDVDLCLVADGATRQLEAAQGFARVIRPIRPKPSFTLVPITPERLAEKRRVQDFFFETVLREGVCLATQN
jgi:uncharacterized protein